MKRLIFSLLISLITISAFAKKDVTKFLGIPVDGTKSEMIQKLKAKGFKSSYYDNEILEGEFNGRSVKIFISTASNIVNHIIVLYGNKLNRKNVIAQFNELLNQFNNKTDKYANLSGTCEIFETGDDNTAQIMFDYRIKESGYRAIYAQRPEAEINKIVEKRLSNKYSIDELNNPDLKIGLDILGEKINYILEENKIVSFKIFEDEYQKYNLVIFYDNLFNQANGEDL